MSSLTLQEKTKWVSFGPDAEIGIRLLSRRALDKVREQAVTRSRVTGRTVSDHEAEELIKKAVIGWRHSSDPNHPGLIVDGEPYPYSVDNALRLADNVKFWRFVNAICVDQDEFVDEPAVLAAEKNG